MAEPTDAEYLYYARKFLAREQQRNITAGVATVIAVLLYMDASAGSLAAYFTLGALMLIWKELRHRREAKPLTDEQRRQRALLHKWAEDRRAEREANRPLPEIGPDHPNRSFQKLNAARRQSAA